MKIYKGDQNFMKSPPKKPSMLKQIMKKGIKFGARVAFSPLSIGLTAGTVLYKGAKNQKGINFVKGRQFDKRGRKA